MSSSDVHTNKKVKRSGVETNSRLDIAALYTKQTKPTGAKIAKLRLYAGTRSKTRAVPLLVQAKLAKGGIRFANEHGSFQLVDHEFDDILNSMEVATAKTGKGKLSGMIPEFHLLQSVNRPHATSHPDNSGPLAAAAAKNNDDVDHATFATTKLSLDPAVAVPVSKSANMDPAAAKPTKDMEDLTVATSELTLGSTTSTKRAHNDDEKNPEKPTSHASDIAARPKLTPRSPLNSKVSWDSGFMVTNMAIQAYCTMEDFECDMWKQAESGNCKRVKKNMNYRNMDM
jgi:hypothetical protein